MGEHPATSGDLIEIRDSKTFYGAFFVVLAAMAMMSSPWPWTVLFGVQSLWALLRVARRRVRLRVTEDGIVEETFRWYSAGLIRWEEIRDVRVTRGGGIEIELKDEKAFLKRLSPLSVLARVSQRFIFRVGPATISPLSLEGSKRELVESLESALDSFTLTSIRQSATLGSDEAAT